MKRANGKGSISHYKQKKLYQVRVPVRENGITKRKSLGYYKTRKEAQKVLDEYNFNPYDIDGSAMTFKDLYEIFYKMKKENITILSNYIQKSINKKGSATIYSKFEKDALIVSDEKNNLLFSEKISKNLSKIATYFKSKQIYQLKDGRIFVSSDYSLENNEDKSRTVSETLLKKSINLKNVFDFIDLTGDLNDSSEKNFAKVENYKAMVYDKNQKLIFTTTYKNKKLVGEGQVDGTSMKLIYIFEDDSFDKGNITMYMDNALFATLRVINSTQDGEMKMYNSSGKVLSTLVFKNGKLNGPSKMYYDNGNVMMIINFKDDEPIGKPIFYDEDGKILDK